MDALVMLLLRIDSKSEIHFCCCFNIEVLVLRKTSKFGYIQLSIGGFLARKSADVFLAVRKPPVWNFVPSTASHPCRVLA